MEEGYALHYAEGGPAPSPAPSVRLTRPPNLPPVGGFGLSLPTENRTEPVEDTRARTLLRTSLSAPRDPAFERLMAFLDADSGTEGEEFVQELLASDRDPQHIARLLFEPAARAVGEAWCADARDFTRVTFAVSRLQRLFWQLAARRPPRPCRASARLALLAPAPGEQHTFGLSLVEDALRRAGWEVDCCRFGEEAEIFRLVARNHYCFVGLSLGSEALLPAFASAIRRLRSRSRNPSVTVLGGGSLFGERPDLAIRAGADRVARDAWSLCGLAEEIFAASLQHAPRVAAE